MPRMHVEAARLGMRPAGARVRFGYVGRMHPTKGLTELVRAVAAIPREVPFRLEIRGPIIDEASRRYASELQAMAAGDRAGRVRPGCSRRRTCPRCSRDTTRCCVRRSGSRTARPSRSKRSPPARRSSRSRVGNLAELIADDVNGLLVAPGDINAWSRALTRAATVAGRDGGSLAPRADAAADDGRGRDATICRSTPLDCVAMSRPTLSARASYGFTVLGRASGVLMARLHRARSGHVSAPPCRSTAMFDTAVAAGARTRASGARAIRSLPVRCHERAAAARPDRVRVRHAPPRDRSWKALRVVDVGTGRSTFPGWMSRAGASVTTVRPGQAGGTGLPAVSSNASIRWSGRMPRRAAAVVCGSMRSLPFADGSVDLVTSLSVVEHLDTDLPARTYVPYDEQQRRLAEVLDEMIRVTRPGGSFYLTSECCDYEPRDHRQLARRVLLRGRAARCRRPGRSTMCRDCSTTTWRSAAARSSAACSSTRMTSRMPRRWTSRGPYFSGFSLLARKR